MVEIRFERPPNIFRQRGIDFLSDVRIWKFWSPIAATPSFVRRMKFRCWKIWNISVSTTTIIPWASISNGATCSLKNAMAIRFLRSSKLYWKKEILIWKNYESTNFGEKSKIWTNYQILPNSESIDFFNVTYEHDNFNLENLTSFWRLWSLKHLKINNLLATDFAFDKIAYLLRHLETLHVTRLINFSTVNSKLWFSNPRSSPFNNYKKSFFSEKTRSVDGMRKFNGIGIG